MARNLRLVLLAASFVTWAQGNTNIRFVKISPGGNMTIVCSTKENQDALTLYFSQPEPKQLLYLNGHPRLLTISEKFKSRVSTAGELRMFSVTINNQTESNSGLYWCQYNRVDPSTNRLLKSLGEDQAVMVYIADPPTTKSPTTAVAFSQETGCGTDDCNGGDAKMMAIMLAVTTCCLLLLCILFFICVIPKIRRFQKSRGQFHPRAHEDVYEDMHPKLRPSTGLS
ncbi:hypothetical protein GJAV_G00223710 [Gymnothorax javanicus]|nr:hypothetical protein GJAV_G00223710 [Gymnothorax javanicus]